jgi:hypothetical protein
VITCSSPKHFQFILISTFRWNVECHNSRLEDLTASFLYKKGTNIDTWMDGRMDADGRMAGLMGRRKAGNK